MADPRSILTASRAVVRVGRALARATDACINLCCGDPPPPSGCCLIVCEDGCSFFPCSSDFAIPCYEMGSYRAEVSDRYEMHLYLSDFETARQRAGGTCLPDSWYETRLYENVWNYNFTCNPPTGQDGLTCSLVSRRYNLSYWDPSICNYRDFPSFDQRIGQCWDGGFPVPLTWAGQECPDWDWQGQAPDALGIAPYLNHLTYLISDGLQPCEGTDLTYVVHNPLGLYDNQVVTIDEWALSRTPTFMRGMVRGRVSFRNPDPPYFGQEVFRIEFNTNASARLSDIGPCQEPGAGCGQPNACPSSLNRPPRSLRRGNVQPTGTVAMLVGMV